MNYKSIVIGETYVPVSDSSQSFSATEFTLIRSPLLFWHDLRAAYHVWTVVDKWYSLIPNGLNEISKKTKGNEYTSVGKPQNKAKCGWFKYLKIAVRCD